MKKHYSTWCPETLILVGLTTACSGGGVATPVTSGSGGSGQGGASATSVAQQGGDTNAGTSTGGSLMGGTASDGSPQVGGQSSAPPAGGGSSAGASPAIGGASTGGARTGGATNGGASTGGARTGGATNGGASTGGARTGGAMNGGASTGGSPAATGGIGTGNTSSGCSQTTVTTGATIDGTITVGSTQRTYRLSVPADAAGGPLPLVFGWNGVGGDGKGAQSYIKIETNHHGIFVYPDPNRTDGWDYNDKGADEAFFDALIVYLTQNYCIDMNRIFSLGLSAGGIMSNKLGCFRGDVLRAIAPSSAMSWSSSGCKGDVAVMIICGTQDTYNGCNDATNGVPTETAVWLPRNGCGSTTTTSTISDLCQQYAGCAAPDPVLVCTHSGGHGWPTSLSDATWNFFMSL